MNDPLFGTDGIRGRANVEPLIPEKLAAIGRAIGEALVDRGAPPKAILGRDTRESGPMVGGAVLAGLLSAGIDVLAGGVLPTPAVARLAIARKCGAGIVISASHNPAADNGVKIFLEDGRKAAGAFLEEVTSRLEGSRRAGGKIGLYDMLSDGAGAYVDLLLSDFRDLDLSGMTVVVDTANGAMVEAAPAALTRLGARVVPLHSEPDGRNINLGCGALEPAGMAQAVLDEGCDAGISFDGDGDRAIFADEKGRILDGDATMAILARDFLARDRLDGRIVVATVMSNLGLMTSLGRAGVTLRRTPVGDRFVVDEMERSHAILGGEQSGHIVVRKGDRLVGDGLETALHLLAALRRSEGPLSGLGACYRRAPQTLLNVPVSSKPDLDGLPGVAEAVQSAREELGEEGRVVLRYSGTEPLARVMVEATEEAVARAAAEKIAVAIETQIGSTS